MSLIASFIGAGIAAGVLLIASSFTDRPTRSHGLGFDSHVSLPADFSKRFVRAIAVALLFGLVTRWPVGALAGAVLGYFYDDVIGTKNNRNAEVAKTEAIATWTEMLRDTLSGAHGLEETIIASADVAPDAIRREVVMLATALERESLDKALVGFATDLAHPTGDLVVTALRLAASESTRELGDLLGTLADAARDECGMRLRIEAARARMRTAVRVITGCTLLTATGLAVLNRPYLAVYGDLTGQAVLALIVALWAGALWWLSKMGTFIAPERFLNVGDAK
jgi:hypothetical protein